MRGKIVGWRQLNVIKRDTPDWRVCLQAGGEPAESAIAEGSIGLTLFDDFQVGDIIEFYAMTKQ